MLKQCLISWFLVKDDVTITDLIHPHFIGERNGSRMAIFLLEYLFVIRVKRRQLVFDKKSFQENEVQASFECKVKWKLKADARRFDNDKFKKVWGETKAELLCRL